MTKKYYELHITMENDDPVHTKELVEGIGWTYSKIDGDPTLGAGVKQYATKQLPERMPLEHVKDILLYDSTRLQSRDLNVRRIKIELVLLDLRRAINEHKN